MSTAVIKALRLTQMENDLIVINREIKMREGILNSAKTFHKQKQDSKKKLMELIKRKNILINYITEAALLDA